MQAHIAFKIVLSSALQLQLVGMLVIDEWTGVKLDKMYKHVKEN